MCSFSILTLADQSNPNDTSQKHFTLKENAVIEQIMEVIEQQNLSAGHANVLLGRTFQLLDWGKRAVNQMPKANA